ncbi:MAG: hypothetical protein FWC50_15105 [Planctomycetaceae bacterium]|nr:hypothetical protein [Planctomycetaceae bacterium]
MPMTEQSIVLSGAASQLIFAASALELAKSYMTPEQSEGFDKIIADDRKLAAKIKQLVKEMKEKNEQ